MTLQHRAQRTGRGYTRYYPQGVTEYVAVLLIGKGVATLLVLLGQQVEECPHILFVNELSFLIGTEELAEVEGYVLIGKIV